MRRLFLRPKTSANIPDGTSASMETKWNTVSNIPTSITEKPWEIKSNTHAAPAIEMFPRQLKIYSFLSCDLTLSIKKLLSIREDPRSEYVFYRQVLIVLFPAKGRTTPVGVFVITVHKLNVGRDPIHILRPFRVFMR